MRIGQYLDEQVKSGLKGDFDSGWKISEKLEKKAPNDPRAKFNRGWFLLTKGKLLDGHRAMDAGRQINVFGNSHCGTSAPIWDGKSKGNIMLVLEGGIGDQIHGLRFVDYIKPTVIACSKEIWPLIDTDIQLVTIEAAGGVDIQYWVPSMSAVTILELEYADIKGHSYINKTAQPIKDRIGIRWSGNPEFEHQQHRLFPANLMFDAIKGLDCISLQRDGGSELKPNYMPQADVTDWTATRREISLCELVITSCTSVAHLSAAMGVPTWIVVPVLSYYLWAMPGIKSPFYDSVTLFRQEKYGDWSAPFEKIKQNLSQLNIAA